VALARPRRIHTIAAVAAVTVRSQANLVAIPHELSQAQPQQKVALSPWMLLKVHGQPSRELAVLGEQGQVLVGADAASAGVQRGGLFRHLPRPRRRLPGADERQQFSPGNTHQARGLGVGIEDDRQVPEPPVRVHPAKPVIGRNEPGVIRKPRPQLTGADQPTTGPAQQSGHDIRKRGPGYPSVLAPHVGSGPVHEPGTEFLVDLLREVIGRPRDAGQRLGERLVGEVPPPGHGGDSRSLLGARQDHHGRFT
jgi:hypothetical protein